MHSGFSNEILPDRYVIPDAQQIVSKHRMQQYNDNMTSNHDHPCTNVKQYTSSTWITMCATDIFLHAFGNG